MSPTKSQVEQALSFDPSQNIFMKALYDLFKVQPEFAEDYELIGEVVRNSNDEWVLRNQRNWSLEVTIAALYVLRNKGDNPRARNEDTIRFADDVRKGKVVIEDIVYEQNKRKRRR